MKYFVTGTAGFIGFHLASRLVQDGHEVVGLDGMTPYYDVTLKQHRHMILSQHPSFQAHEFLLEDDDRLGALMRETAPDVVIHLAAQAGVRYSLENPRAYISANLVGTFNVLDHARALGVGHVLLASTSSVYGANKTMPFHEEQRTDHPLTLYAATKKATESIAHSYSHLWSLPTTVFRFFTVYGPWGRPDMALFKFTEKTLKGQPIDVYNHGKMERDFTYIDDLVEGIVRLAARPPVRAASDESDDTNASDVAPFRVVNIGNSQPLNLLEFIAAIEKSTGTPTIRNYMDMQPGDVPRTWADTDLLQKVTGFRPATPVSEGVDAFVRWYRDYYRV